MKTVFRHKHNKKELHPLYSYINEVQTKRKKEYEKFIEHTSDIFSIPQDVLTGQAIISMFGNHMIRICNYQLVEEYSTEKIRLSVGKKSLVISGTHLFIDILRKEEIIINGNIGSVSYIE